MSRWRIPPSNTWSLRYDATDGKLIKETAKAAKNGPVTENGVFSFAGIDDKYFTAVLPSRRHARASSP